MCHTIIDFEFRGEAKTHHFLSIKSAYGEVISIEIDLDEPG